MSTFSNRIQKLQDILSRRGRERIKTSDSAYGRRPSDAGPIEDMSITLTPTDPCKDDVEVVSRGKGSTISKRVKA